VAALLIVVNINIRTVQADVYYKQGLAYEGAGAWESAVILYREAARLEPKEDYYYLFLGRALLQYAMEAEQGGAPVLPENLSGVKTSELLPLMDLGLRAGGRENILRATQAALEAARRLNPYNTDHSANLARLNRAWAFVNAVVPGELPDDMRLRELVASAPSEVNVARLADAQTYFEQATSLSPQNAQLWNELASVQFIRGDTEGALKTLERSLALDEQFGQTYLLRVGKRKFKRVHLETDL